MPYIPEPVPEPPAEIKPEPVPRPIHHYGRYPSTLEHVRVCAWRGGSGIGSFEEIILSLRKNNVMCGECLKRMCPFGKDAQG